MTGKIFTAVLLMASLSAMAQPTTVPEPVATGNNAIGIYSSTLGNTDGYFFADWGCGNVGSEVTVGSSKVFKIPNFTYYGSQFTAIDLTSMKYLVVDVYPESDMTLTVDPITGTVEKGVQTSLTGGQWNTIKIPIATFTQKGCNMANLYQIKYMGTLAADGGDGNVDGFGTGDGTQSFIVGNVYFYNEVSTGVNGVNVAQPVVDGPAFNVAGQQVSSDYKGIVVKNGKKYINR